MVYVPPPPLLVVRSHDPARRWRAVVLVVLGWLASVAGAAAGVALLRERFVAAADAAVVSRMTRDNGDLRQRVAVLERSEQVARAANADLQQVLRDRQEQISALRADLGFYARLTGGGARREGLAVQAMNLAPAAEKGVYNFTVTLTQNMKAGQLASGRARFSVAGIHNGRIATLNWSELASSQDRDGLAFSFKYFQQLKGALMLPEGFMPNRIHAEADAGGEFGRAEQDFAWAEAMTTPEVSYVQQ